jgi:hypothetical protein
MGTYTGAKQLCKGVKGPRKSWPLRPSQRSQALLFVEITYETADGAYCCDNAHASRLIDPEPARRGWLSAALLLHRSAIHQGWLLESALEGPRETGGVSVTHGCGDLLDPQPGARQEQGGLLQPLLGQAMTQAHPGHLLEQVLQARLAQVEYECQLGNRVRRFRLDQFQDPADTVFRHYDTVCAAHEFERLYYLAAARSTDQRN